MKTFNRIAFFLIFVAAAVSCGSNNNISKTISVPDISLTDISNTDISNPNNVLIFSITTYDGATESKPFVKSLGHSWVSLENKTGHSVFIKDYELQNNQAVAFSVWSISGHGGVYFNIEPNFIKQNGRYDGRKSLSVNIDESKLDDIQDFINNNDRWTSLKNCSYWSLTLWNKIVDEQYRLYPLPVIYTPSKIQNLMKKFDCVEVNKDFSSAGGIFHYLNNVSQEMTLCARNVK